MPKQTTHPSSRHFAALNVMTAVRAERIARCFHIARECLDGDPFREVPELELESDRLALTAQARELTPAMIEDAQDMHLPAYLVAENTLQLVEQFSQEETL